MCAAEKRDLAGALDGACDPALEGPSAEEIASASDVMSTMVRTAKGLRMYLPNNPVLIRFLEELQEKMTTHLTRFGAYQLEVHPFALSYGNTEVYRNSEAKENMALRMHSDGIRGLRFAPGLSEQELAAFVEIVGVERPNRDDDDVVTRLWELSPPHISHLLEDDFVAVDALEAESEAAGSQQAAVTEVFRTLAASTQDRPRMVPKHLLMLTAAEATWLRAAIQADARRSPPDEVINILSATLVGVQDPQSFADFTGIAAKLAIDLLVARETGHALRIFRFLGQLLTLGSLAPARREVVAGALSGVLSPEALQALQEIIDGSDALSHQELRELLLILGLPSLGAMCELLGRVEKLKMRKVVIEVLVELGKENPEVFTPFLSDSRWYLVRNVVLVLTLLGTPVALQMIVGLISHREQRIRKEVLVFLEQTPDTKARPYILKFLRDESSLLRIRALRTIARQKLGFALKPVLAIATGDDFKTRGMEERIAVFETLGELGSVQMVPFFRDLLVKKGWFKRAVAKESAVYAVAGLLKVRHPAALELIEELRGNGGAELRGVINEAMETVAAETGKTAA